MNLTQALCDGLIISVMLYGWVLIILKINPRFELKSYPKSITDAVPKQTPDEKKRFLLLAIPMLVVIITYVGYTMITTYQDSYYTFGILFLHLLVIFVIANLVDLLIMDWLLFCTIKPAFMRMPGTDKHHIGYRDYHYHFIGFLKGTSISVAAAAIIAAVIWITLSML